jgi:hypothetical protein
MNSETAEDTEERRGGIHLSAGIYTDVIKLSSFYNLYQVDPVRWPGSRRGGMPCRFWYFLRLRQKGKKKWRKVLLIILTNSVLRPMGHRNTHVPPRALCGMTR